MQPKIHLIQSFLHVLDVHRCRLDETFPMPYNRAYCANRLRRSERGAQ
jgi:hypothetical protein